MSDLTDFLLARLAEDEQMAKDPQTAYTLHWPRCDYPGDMPGICTCNAMGRLLAEVAAKRRIVEEHRHESVTESNPLNGLDHTFAECDTCGIVSEFGCPTLRALASVYADHPEFREEWAL